MAIAAKAPNTIHLSGPCLIDMQYPAGEAITPGHLVELYNDSGTIKVRKHATSTEVVTHAVALDLPEWNKTVDDAYAIGDQVKIGFMCAGCTWWGLLPSGQNIAPAAFLQSNGAGTLKAATATTAAANVAKFQALENIGAITVLTRVRVQVI